MAGKWGSALCRENEYAHGQVSFIHSFILSMLEKISLQIYPNASMNANTIAIIIEETPFYLTNARLYSILQKSSDGQTDWSLMHISSNTCAL